MASATQADLSRRSVPIGKHATARVGAGERGGSSGAGTAGTRWTSRVLRCRIVAMRQDEIWDDDAARRYDTPGTDMFAPEVLGQTVDRLAALAGDGRALELAIGTGRVAVPLAGRGVEVTGI